MNKQDSAIFSRIKKRINLLIFAIWENFIKATIPFWNKILRKVAETGLGSDNCLKNGYLPMPVHYYSPVPDISDLEERKVWSKKSDLGGIAFQPNKQIQFMKKIGNKFGQECAWPGQPDKNNPSSFYTENNSFSFGCAAALHSIIRYHKPKRIIEIGSGFSSIVISSAVALNDIEGVQNQYTIIDPYPDFVTERKISGIDELVRTRVELTDAERFVKLECNDILFIDSGHTVRTGSDVNFLYLDVLPNLAPGVLVHIHDVCLPYEYPQAYFTNPSFRVFWTEAYLLQAFLAFNSKFEILMALGYLMTDHKNEFQNAFPHYDSSIHKAVSGSFWIQRTK